MHKFMLAIVVLGMMASGAGQVWAEAPALQFTMKNIDGHEVNLAEKYGGKVVLIVNTASKCGYTPQYKGLEAVYRQFKDQGLMVLSFPCNQFGHQEPGSADDIKKFCHAKYDVTFDMFAKIDVNGDDAAPLYKYLKATDGQGPIKWNFEKFLIGRDGRLIRRYRSPVKPEQIAKDIEHALAQKQAESAKEH